MKKSKAPLLKSTKMPKDDGDATLEGYAGAKKQLYRQKSMGKGFKYNKQGNC